MLGLPSQSRPLANLKRDRPRQRGRRPQRRRLEPSIRDDAHPDRGFGASLGLEIVGGGIAGIDVHHHQALREHFAEQASPDQEPEAHDEFPSPVWILVGLPDQPACPHGHDRDQHNHIAKELHFGPGDEDERHQKDHRQGPGPDVPTPTGCREPGQTEQKRPNAEALHQVGDVEQGPWGRRHKHQTMALGGVSELISKVPPKDLGLGQNPGSRE